MNLQEQNILFFTRTMGLGGTENVVLQLCEIFQSKVNKIIVCSCGGVNVEKLNQMGVKHVQINDIEQKSPSVVMGNIRILRKIIKEEKITIIHTHHRMAAFYVALLRLYNCCVYINTSHNTFTDKKFLTRLAYKHGNLIACGEMVKQNLVGEFEIPNKQVTVIRNAVKSFDGNVVIDSLIKEFHDKGCLVIGNIGRLSKQKGMEYFIQSIPNVIKEHSNVKFVIAGSGEDEEKLKKLSKEIKVEKHLSFLGYRTDIQNLISQLDIIVLSSLWEGLPLTPIEAFSVGKTIIATDVDGTPEVVKNMRNGLIVEPRNSMLIAEKINYLLDNKQVLDELQNNAKIDYNNGFSFERLKKDYLDYYGRI